MIKLNRLLVAATMFAAPVPALAATLDLSATDYSASSATYAFEAGTYTVSLVSDMYTAWSARDINRNPEPWVGYYTYTANGVTTLFNPEGYARFATQAAALAAYSEDGPLTLTFAAPTAVTFAIADAASSFGDNAGGLSLNIAAVPEPSTWGMMALGFLGLGATLRRRSRAVVTA
ncbi:MAG TPA: PEP-CTERM sorting domain-containing protein [Sphingomonas sp.]|nr:PEP-CTERM sorting domain-containing protein [Sphingomonas sp.]